VGREECSIGVIDLLPEYTPVLFFVSLLSLPISYIYVYKPLDDWLMCVGEERRLLMAPLTFYGPSHVRHSASPQRWVALNVNGQGSGQGGGIIDEMKGGMTNN
jgi:hypothetical protein